MSKLKVWIATARPPTLLLSISGILVGGSLAYKSDNFSWIVLILIILTAICLQVLANFSNDYGDYIKGTDNQNRKGPKRALQKGLLTTKEVKTANRILIVLISLLGLSFLFLSFGLEDVTYTIIIGQILVISIFAAIKYTNGKYAYGYKGFGDLSVFIFFGGFSVLGTEFILSHELNVMGLFWAIVIGCCCVSVLNINNIRDIENDRIQKKNTLAVLLGQKLTFIYHYCITFVIVLFLTYLNSYHFQGTRIENIIHVIITVFFLLHAVLLSRANKQNKMNLMLKLMVLLTFIVALFSFVKSIIEI